VFLSSESRKPGQVPSSAAVSQNQYNEPFDRGRVGEVVDATARRVIDDILSILEQIVQQAKNNEKEKPWVL
jgi:hypothetical protein